ncbi:hypothetical protein D3C85_1898160 [compost metagenome]
MVEADFQLRTVGFQAQQVALAHLSAKAANSQAVASLGAVHLMQVLQAPAFQVRTVRRDEVGVFE